MRGRNLSILAVALVLLALSLYIGFSANQITAASPSEVCKLPGEKWDYSANDNFPPFDCCPGFWACTDGYCCETESNHVMLTAGIITKPTGDLNDPVKIAEKSEPVIIELSEIPAENDNPGELEQTSLPFVKKVNTEEPIIISERYSTSGNEESAEPTTEEPEPLDIPWIPEAPEPVVTCYQNSDCGLSGWTGSPYCKNGDVWQKWRTYTCKSPGTEYSYCLESRQEVKKHDCNDGCEYGSCTNTVIILDYACYNDSDCGTNGWLGWDYCGSGGGENEDVYDTYRTYTCNNPGTSSAYCTHADEDKIKEDCGDTTYGDWGDPYCYDGDVYRAREGWWRGCDEYGCYEGHGLDYEKVTECGSYTCTNGQCDFVCYQDSDCGTDGYVGNKYCSGGDVYQDYRTWTCNNAGTISSSCSYSDTSTKMEECGTKDCVNGVCVTPANNPPSIDSYSPTSNPSINLGDSQTFSITKSDPDGDTLTVKWYVDDVQKKQGSDYYTYTPNSVGTYEVKVTVSDGKDTVSHIWTLTVTQQGNNPPSIDSYSPITSNPKIDLNKQQKFTITKSDPDGDSLTVKWYVDGVRKSQGTDIYTYLGLIPGNYEIKVEVSDGWATVSHVWILTVNKPANQPPQINSYSPTTDPTISLGQSQKFTITKSDPDGDSLTVKWYVKGNLKKEDSNSFTYKPTSSGTYRVKVEVSDGWATVSRTWTLTVKGGSGELPDLRVTDLRVVWPPDKIIVGDTVSFEFVIKNIGQKKADNVRFRLRMGESTWNSPSPISSLDAGDEIKVVHSYVYSASGAYTITAIVDPANSIAESNENNNEMSIDIQVDSKKGTATR